MKSNEQFIQGIYEKRENEQHVKEITHNINSYSKRIIATVCISIIVVGCGITYGINVIQNKIKFNPTLQGDIKSNSIWVGSFQLAWNELVDFVNKGPIEFEGEKPTALLNQLNAKAFNKSMLSEDAYYVSYGPLNNETEERMKQEIRQKLNIIIENSVLNKLKWNSRGYAIYALLKKEFTFPIPFDRLYNQEFAKKKETTLETNQTVNFSIVPSQVNPFSNNSETIKKVKYFGINNASKEELNNNVEVLFHNNAKNNFAVKLKTTGKDEVFLYRTEDTSSFEQLYKDMLKKEEEYKGSKEFKKADELAVPYIKVKADINYEELCNKYIVGMKDAYLADAIQTIDFELNETGGKVTSEVGISDIYMSVSEEPRYFFYTDTFVMFLKEKGKELPYLALRIEDDTYLQEGDDRFKGEI